MLLPSLGDHHHDGLGNRITGHDQQLKAIVKGRRVGLSWVDDRVKFGEILFEHRRAHHAFACSQPVVVAFHGINFTVMGN